MNAPASIDMNTITTTQEAYADLTRAYPGKTVSAAKKRDNFRGDGIARDSWSLHAFPADGVCETAEGPTYEEAFAKLDKLMKRSDPAERLREQAAKLGMKLVPAEA